MLLLTRATGQGEGVAPCLLFGEGLIGSAVARRLAELGYRAIRRREPHWQDTKRRGAQLAQLARDLDRVMADDAAPLQLIWCAGSGSFSADREQLLPERRAFDTTLAWTSEQTRHRPVRFHFVSSAGALFEGQVRVDERSTPAPRSAYGAMKFEQEAALAARSDGLDAVIYRPSTVYGSHEFHRRAGLVSHLMWNALRQEPTVLEANVHALRDFVHHEDVGRYLAEEVVAGAGGAASTRHLVAAKPSSIREVFHHVERLFGRALPYRLAARGGNDADITFSERLMPPNWSPRPLAVGLSSVWRETRRSYLSERPEVRAAS